MVAFLESSNAFQIFAVCGAVIPLTASLIAAVAYRGKAGEPYSPLNHFISELGEVGVSKLAWVFNSGLILAGLCLLPAGISLGLMVDNIFGKIAMGLAIISALSLALVGVFPMNQIKPHGYAAMTYFRSGLLMVILFSLAVAFQHVGAIVLNRWLSLAGLLPIGSFSAFLIMIRKAYKEKEDPLATEDVPRPTVWNLAVVEWSIFVTMLVWIGILALRV